MTTLKQISIVILMTLASSQCFAVATTDTQSNATSNSNSSGQTQGFTFAPNTTSTYNNRTISPTYASPVQLGFPQNFLDPGVSATAMADPLVWYYMEALASSCEEEPEIIVAEEKWVTINYQPDCGTFNGVRKNTPLGNITATVDFKSDFDKNAYYVPLGMISVAANWNTAENINLLTLIKSVQRYVKENVNGYDRIVIVSDILRRTVATQRSTEAEAQGFSFSPSISSGFGTDSLVGNIFGYGESNGSARPLSRKGASFVIAAVSPGPWLGTQPRLSQNEYFKQFIALPQELSVPTKALKNGHDKDKEDKPMTPVELETKALTR